MRAAPAASGWQVYAVCWEQYYGSCNPPCWSLGRWFWERFLTRLGKKKSVRLAARQLNAFRRVSEMGIKPMNSAAWRAGAPPRHAKFRGCLSSCSKKCWMEEKGGLCATSLPPVFHGSQLMVRRRWRNSWFSVFSQIASMLEEMTQTAIPRSAQATSRSIISS